MIVIIIFIGLIVGLNFIPVFIDTNFPKAKKVIVKMLIISAFLFLIVTIFEFNRLRIKGLYTFSIIGLAFIVSSFLYFSIFKNTIKKMLIFFLITPILILSFFTLMFGRTLHEFNINEKYKIAVTRGGFMTCPEHIIITQTKFMFFDQEVYHDGNICLTGIWKIETVYFNERKAEFLIYHDREMDSENPYKYEVNDENLR